MNKNIWTKTKGLHCIIQETELKECHVNTKKCKKQEYRPKDEGRQCRESPTTNAENFGSENFSLVFSTKVSVALPTTVAC